MTWLWETSDIIYFILRENLSCRIKILKILRYALLLSFFFLIWVAWLFYRPALLIVKMLSSDIKTLHSATRCSLPFFCAFVESKYRPVETNPSTKHLLIRKLFDLGCRAFYTTEFRLPADYERKPIYLIDLQGTIHGRQVARATALCEVATNKCRSSEWNLFCFAILTPSCP